MLLQRLFRRLFPARLEGVRPDVRALVRESVASGNLPSVCYRNAVEAPREALKLLLPAAL